MFRGKVSQVRKAATVVQNVVTYTAIIATANPDLRLFPGMTADVRIVVDTREDVLRIPNSALRYRPSGAMLAHAGATGAAVPADDGGRAHGGGTGTDAAREGLAKELDLTAEQQARMDAIAKETREKMRALEALDKGERRKQTERLRAEQRERVAEILNPGQRRRYSEMATGRSVAGREETSGHVWLPDAAGVPRAIPVRSGLSDGTHSELVSGDLQEGAQVIVGALGTAGTKSPAKSGPRFGFF